MIHQPDFFAAPARPVADSDDDEPTRPAMAVPCGFVDRHNRRCQRLAVRPVMMGGFQATCRGAPLLHCDPACFATARDDVASEGIA
ncbi:hypothetical protein [Sphingomonas sp. PB1R3]|uniref:hypothetical protein n=1 Tax=Sphingomonas flavida TaxID=3096154 RepID=UPI002FCC1B20